MTTPTPPSATDRIEQIRRRIADGDDVILRSTIRPLDDMDITDYVESLEAQRAGVAGEEGVSEMTKEERALRSAALEEAAKIVEATVGEDGYIGSLHSCGWDECCADYLPSKLGNLIRAAKKRA